MKKRILFIINPISGGKDKTIFPRQINKYLDLAKFEVEYLLTEGAGHARETAARAIENGLKLVVAVGGDGTINEVASAVEGTDCTMGIIPYGSGNGLARSLKIPLNIKKAIKKLNNGNDRLIDSGELNNRKFFNMAGLGFDAHISDCFTKDPSRGFWGYVRTAFSEIRKYRSQQYTVAIDGEVYQREAFMISFANSSQFGNNAYVSPHASLTDGLLDVCIIKPFPLLHFFVMGYHMFSNTADKSKYVEIIRGKNIEVTREKGGPVHVDGEPVIMGAGLNISLSPLSLKVIV